MPQATILPDPTQLGLVRLSASDTCITAVVETLASGTPCPLCGEAATRVHSRYVRTVADLPWHGVAFQLRLQVRRFFCEQAGCPRAIFTERLPTVVAPYARRTVRLAEVLQLVGWVAGGAAGSRLLVALGLGREGNGVPAASPDTLLRAIRRAAPAPAATPRVLSVDDFAFRRGMRYGTILVDLERHRLVDLLPDRTAATFARWLREHPGVEVICRDRGGAYAEGGRQGAPHALQVADRFHLLKNLLESLDRLLIRQQRLLTQVATEVAASTAAAPLPETSAEQTPPAAASPGHPPAPQAPRRCAPRHERASAARGERRRARYEAVMEAQRAGMPVQTIAQRVGLARNTVRRYVRSDGYPEPALRRRRWRKMTPFEGYLRERWDAGEQNAATLCREIQAQGYTGSASTLRDQLSGWRSGPRRPGRRPVACTGQPAPPPARTFSARQTRWLLVGASGGTGRDVDATATAYATALVERSPCIRQAQVLVTAFFRFVRDRDASGLEPWLAHAQGSEIAELRSFADGIRRDFAAVAAALGAQWSQGQTEGQVNRLKLIKRQMYGRAHFELLRKRVLARSAA